MKTETNLSIISPIYNPPQDWEIKIEHSLANLFLLFDKIDVKVVFVNDGSSLDLEEGFSHLKNRFPAVEILAYVQNQGKGYAIKTGLGHAESNYYIYTDWDFPFGEEALLTFYQNLIQNEYDLIIGKRSKAYYASLPPFRKLISLGLRTANFFFLNCRNLDTQAGIKALNKPARELFLANKTNSFIYELEFVSACLKNKMRISSIAVTPRKDIVFTNFKFNTILKEFTSYINLIKRR